MPAALACSSVSKCDRQKQEGVWLLIFRLALI